MIRIGNASGFYGDRFSAVREMLEGGHLDVLTGDYLAELTMLILGRDRLKDAELGYARTFLRQMEDCLGLALDKGVKIVTNAGGLNPAGLAEALGKLGLHARSATSPATTWTRTVPGRADRQRLPWRVGHRRVPERRCGRRGDRARHRRVARRRPGGGTLRLGPRRLATRSPVPRSPGTCWSAAPRPPAATIAFFTEIDASRPGFPIAEIDADGSAVITKHERHGRRGHRRHGHGAAALRDRRPGYLGPDVMSHFDTISLSSAPTASASAVCRAARRRTRSRSA